MYNNQKVIWKTFSCHALVATKRSSKKLLVVMPLLQSKGHPKNFQSPRPHGNQKNFDFHPHVVIKRFSVTTIMWQLNSITIWLHRPNLIIVGWWLCILVTIDGFIGIFGRYLGTVKWKLICFNCLMAADFGRGF